MKKTAEAAKKAIALAVALSLSPLAGVCAELSSPQPAAAAQNGGGEGCFAAFLAARGGEFGLAEKDGELWHSDTVGGSGFGRLSPATAAALEDVLSSVPAQEADGALAEALAGRLGAGERHSGGLFSETQGGGLKLTPAGFKVLLGLLGNGPGPAAPPADVAAEVNAIPAAITEEASLDLNGLRAMSSAAGAGLGAYFDGTEGARSTEVTAVAVAESGLSDSSPAVPAAGVSKSGGSAVPALPASFGDSTSSWRPPDNAKGRIARVAGALMAGAGIGGVSFVFWGPASAAYYLTGSIMRSVSYNSDAIAEAARGVTESAPVKLLADNPLVRKVHGAVKSVGDAFVKTGSTRLFLGLGLSLAGMASGNPVMTYYGMTFGILNAGEMVGKSVFDWAYEKLDHPAAANAGKKLDEAAHRLAGAGVPAAAAEKPAAKPSFVRKVLDAAYNNRGTLARTAAAAAVTMAVMGGFAAGTHMALGDTFGRMTVKDGDLTLLDKAKNSVIGGYRLYNPSGTVLDGGENTARFYKEMKLKYSPATPDDWAAVIEREITWVAHNDLYGTNLYYISSEEAARLTALNGVAGRYSDCTGKAALMYNMLKLDGFGKAEVVVGVPPVGYPDKVGHAWIALPGAQGETGEIFHYSNTQHLVRAQTFGEADGIKGDQMAALAAGGAGGLAAEGIYSLLEKIEERAQKAYGAAVEAGRAVRLLPAPVPAM